VPVIDRKAIRGLIRVVFECKRQLVVARKRRAEAGERDGMTGGFGERIVCAWVECERFVDVRDAEAMVEWDPRTGVDVCMVVR
jgi:hypothetical protein